MISSSTCFSLTEKLKPLYDEYGEEQIIASLYCLLEQGRINTDNTDELISINNRQIDLEELVNKWESQNPPLNEID